MGDGGGRVVMWVGGRRFGMLLLLILRGGNCGGLGTVTAEFVLLPWRSTTLVANCVTETSTLEIQDSGSTNYL